MNKEKIKEVVFLVCLVLFVEHLTLYALDRTFPNPQEALTSEVKHTVQMEDVSTWFSWQPKIELKTELDFYKLPECDFQNFHFNQIDACRLGKDSVRVIADYDLSKVLTP